MNTVVYPPTSPLGFGRYRTVGVVGHHITPADASAICAGLDRRGIPVVVSVKAGVVDVWPQRPVTTVEEVTVLGAVISQTDCPVKWHEAEQRGS